MVMRQDAFIKTFIETDTAFYFTLFSNCSFLTELTSEV